MIVIATSGGNKVTPVAGSTSTPTASTSPNLVTDPNGKQCVTPMTNGDRPGDSAPATSQPATSWTQL